MAVVKAKVNIETARRNYRPGELITEQLSGEDMYYLTRYGFVSVEGEEPDPGKPGGDGDTENLDTTDDAGGEQAGDSYMDDAALRKMNKEEIVAYAQELGLSLDVTSLKSDLIDAVLNRTEELLAVEELADR